MQINHCLILAAGFGTRMGAIGQKLPKVLWPVFEKSLLELQVAYARNLGAERIFINLHHFGKEIEEYCQNRPIFEGVEFLWEQPEILDMGGAIHNLASKVNYKGKALLLNADQFFYMKKEELMAILKPHDKAPSVLFTYWVKASSGYNALEMTPDRLVKSRILNKDLSPDSTVETYTGLALIDFEQLKPVSGKSAFFDTVCLLDKQKIPAVLLDKVDYWDFGTLQRFWETTHRILSTYSANSNHPFLRFLVQERALKTWKINLLEFSYHAKSPNVVNLNQDVENSILNPAIIINGKAEQKNVPTLWWKGMSEEVKLK
jgi:NDP-sugar pyrophosphorylase family protein